MILSVLFLAAETTSDPLDWAKYGVLGLVILGFVTGKIVGGYLLDRAEAKIAERDAIIEKMRMAMEDKTVPALIRNQETMTDVVDLLTEFSRRQQEEERRRRDEGR